MKTVNYQTETRRRMEEKLSVKDFVNAKTKKILKSEPRYITEIVCNDLTQFGLDSTADEFGQYDIFFANGDDFFIVHELEDRSCQVIFSNLSFETLRRNSCGEVPIGIDLRNRRQWRIVKPLVRSIYEEIVGGDGYKLFSAAWERLGEADSIDLDQMVPEQYWWYRL